MILLFLLSSLVLTAHGDVLDLDTVADTYLMNVNERIRLAEKSKIALPSGHITFKNVTYGPGTMFGADSWARIGHSTMTTVGNKTTFDYRFGLQQFHLVFDHLTNDGVEMPSNLTISNSSFRLRYTLDFCDVTLEEFRSDYFGLVEFHPYRSEFEGYDSQDVVDGLVQSLHFLMDYDSPRFQQNVERLCKSFVHASQGLSLFVFMLLGMA